MDLKNLTIKKFHEGLMGKKFSAKEAAETFFSSIKKEDEKYGAYLRLTEELALSQALSVDKKIDGGEKVGALAGVPLAVKDVILIKDEIVSGASKILSEYKAGYDATVIKNLKEENSMFLGYTNCDEFAMGASTENSGIQITKNPHDTSRVPGGSSGGSAAAVAADLTVAALGSDTGGSIREPASFCGVVGLKPTYGSVSRFGLMAMASSLDQIGCLTKTVEDAVILFQAIAGRDEFDATSEEHDWSDVMDFDAERAKGLTVGLPEEYFVEGLDAQVEKGLDEALGRFKKLGIKFKKVSLPHTSLGVSCYYIIMPAEVSSNLARLDGIRYSRIIKDDAIEALLDIYKKQKGEGFGEEVRRRIMLGTFVLSHGYYDAYYAQAQKVRRLICRDFEKAFDSGVDAMLTPVYPTPAFKIGEKASDPLEMYLGDIFTIPTSLAGLPGLSAPVKDYKVGSGELPIGFQLIGKKFREQDILGLGRLYETSS
ncbi:Asp-tRNA(Asn)/Glu-tRNA(Gln) amidotransferase GatCAB subunit A [bacterium]|nr:Asp-tRNA(Asn)/Glu-tRNA(Gln) amidotransferase GatCAB subunit A [bacterium]|tara:strand:- start:426 stop:1877 length:1452 start_codon:yes stop_codon:yes gene_type:complete